MSLKAATTDGKTHRFWRQLRDLPAAMPISAWSAGLVCAVLAFTGPLLLVFQAAANAGLTQPQTASWVWSMTVGTGLLSIVMCLWYRLPICAAWSTGGMALMVSQLRDYPYGEAIGAYIVTGALAAILGWSGYFGRALNLIPRPIVMGMLAGVLFRFGVGVFGGVPAQPWLILAMLVAYLGLRWLNVRVPTVGALAVGLVVSLGFQGVSLAAVNVQATAPVVTWPQFSLPAIVSLSLPLFILAVASQDAPGIAVLRAAGYDPPIGRPKLLTGLASVVLAPLGCPGLNLSTLAVAICSRPEAHPDPDKRYGAGVAAGLWFVLFGWFGATITTLFGVLPRELIAVVAGLSLAPVILTALTEAMNDARHREAALFALLLTAADVTILGIGAAFWGLVLGVVVTRALNRST